MSARPSWVGTFSRDLSLSLQGNVGNIPGLRLGDDCVVGPLDAHRIVAGRLNTPFVGPARPSIKWEKPDPRLFPYQVEGVEQLHGIISQTGGALLTDEMGLGKTLQAISLSVRLGVDLTLVVCPAAVRETWKDQLLKYTFQTAYIVDEGKKLETLPSKGWVIISYELSSKLDQTFRPNLVIFDEVQLAKGRAFKGKGPLRVKAAKHLVVGSDYRLLMTGTPMWDRPRDLWSILDMTWPRRFGSSFEFDAAYCGGHFDAHGGWENKGVESSRLDELKTRLSMLAVSRTKEVIKDQLPELTQNLVWLPENPKATACFRRFLLKDGDVQSAMEAALEFKEPAAVELALQAGDFLLVTWMRKSATSLYQTLKKHGVEVQLITGDTPHSKRQQIIRDCGALKKLGKPTGIVATIESLAAGVDGIQHVTSNGIFHSFLHVPTVMAQTVARLFRLGQKNAVQWTWLGVRNSIEEPLVHKLISKMDAQIKVTGSMSTMRDSFKTSDEETKDVLRALYEAM